MQIPSLWIISLIAAGALLTGGCESPISQGIATDGKDMQNFLVGYEETTYEYPVQVPGTNRWVKIESDQPIDHPVTYEDYLAWKAQQEGQIEETPESGTSKVNAPNRK